jgi:ribosomal protein S18 acetylase RimI-like enzyme
MYVIRRLDLTDGQELTEVLALQRAAYAVEAKLIGTSDIPPLKDTAETLAKCGEIFHGYFDEGRLVGAISHKKVKHTLDIHRLVVNPDHFRRGIARSLVGHVEGIEGTADRIVVSTGARNTPAKLLYRRLGFHETGESEPVPGLRISTFEKPLRSGRRIRWREYRRLSDTDAP